MSFFNYNCGFVAPSLTEVAPVQCQYSPNDNVVCIVFKSHYNTASTGMFSDRSNPLAGFSHGLGLNNICNGIVNNFKTDTAYNKFGWI